MTICKKNLLVFYLFFPFMYVAGQSTVSANDDTSLAADSSVKLYFESQAKTLAIHNGRVFYGYPGVIGDAFYPSKEWQKGSILYDGTWYQDVSMMYDIYSDQVIVLHPNTTFIRLFSERVQKFIYNGQLFVRLGHDKNNVLKEGFYQQLAEGNLSIFVTRHKIIEENIVGLVLERKFIYSNTYYALKDGIYYPINKKKALLSLLKDQRQAIVKQLKQQQINYKEDQEKAIAAIAGFYNQSHK